MGGIYIGGEDATINMDNSYIRWNYAIENGGGIYVGNSGAHIYLENHSSVSGNTARKGGGIYCSKSWFWIESKDKTGSVSYNKATYWVDRFTLCGGGIHVESQSYGSDNGTIQGLTVEGNYSPAHVGGILVSQNQVNIVGCTITGNEADNYAGGLFINRNNCVIKDCTITNNTAGTKGGGMFVDSSYNVELSGTVIVENNKSAQDNCADDLYLETNVLYDAYITGGVSEGSHVGLRTYYTKDRMVGKDIDTYAEGTYFADETDHFVTHGADHNGDLWLRYGKATFAAKVNGETKGTYAQGETVTADATTTADGEHFWYWDAGATTGFNNVGDVINDNNKYQPVITYTMPQANTNLAAVYTDDITFATFTLNTRVVAGQYLPTAGILKRTDEGQGATDTARNISVTWYEVDANGNKTRAYGKAKYGKTYVAEVTVDQDTQEGIYFNRSIQAGNITVRDSSSVSGDAATAASVDEYSGELSFTTCAFETEKLEIASVEGASITVVAGTSEDDLRASLPATAKAILSDGSSLALATDKAAATWQDGLIGADDKVADPGTTSKTYAATLPLAASSQVASVDGKAVEVSVTVLPSESVADPVVEPASGTYTKYDENTALSADGTLTVTATCSTEGAVIKYRTYGDSDWGEWADCPSDGIVLKAAENDQTDVMLQFKAVREVEVAGVKKTVESDVTDAEYLLDDTLGKSITVSCSDTALYADGETRWTSTFAVFGDLKADVTIAAPAQDGRVFDHWEWEGAPEGCDLTQPTLTVSDFSLAYDKKITAVYAPVITALDLGVVAPAAHEALPASASYVKATAAGQTKDIASCFADGASLSWSPAASEDGTAAHLTAYAASLKLGGSSDKSDVKYVLADNVKLLVSGVAADGSARIATAADGTETLCAELPATGGYVYQSLGALDAVDLSFAEAYGYASTGATDWGLPKSVQVTYACGDTDDLSITWNSVEGFDPSRYEAQTVTATGTVEYPSGVDASSAPKTVTATINVAAPETVAAPTATPEAGTYQGTQQAVLSCETEGATIHYTTDGTEPNAQSAVYDGAIEVSGSATIKARAFLDGSAPSEVATFSYTINHTVSFDAANGSAAETQVVEDGKKATKPADPTLTGFDFQGWFTADGSAYDFEKAVISDVALYAHWTASGSATAVWLVAFDSAGGSAVSAQSVADGEKAAKPADPSLDGAAFAGWFTAEGDVYDFDAPVTSNLVLYARWSGSGGGVAAHTVTFKASDDSEPTMVQVVADGERATKPENPTRDGYTFDGWYTEDGKKFSFKTPVTFDLVLVAKWSASDEPVGRVQMLRLYNPYTGEHLYTSSTVERDACVAAGWNFEGNAWVAPSKSSAPVYRLYNPYVEGGDHFYTTDAAEVENLKAAGWSYEGVGWFSDDSQGVKIYRQYNPFAQTGTHNYTASTVEKDSLVALGWRDEQVAWYGMS